MWVPRVATCVRTAAASEDGSLIATAGWMGELQLWSADRDRPIASIYGAPSHPPPVALAYSPRGKYLVVMSQNGRIKVWDAPTAGNLVLRWGNPEEVVGIGLSNDGANIIAAFERGVELLDARMGRRVAYAPIPVTALAVHPKTGEVAVAATDRTVSFWTPELRPTGVTAGPFPAPVTALAFDPVRRSIAVGVETGAVEIWNLERGARVSSTGVDYRVNHMAFTPDGKHLAVAVGNPLQPPRSGGALRILDGATGQPTAASSHPQNVARAFSWLAFNPAGTGILTGFSNSGAAVLYDLKARALAEFSEGAGVMATAFTPDGSRALIAHLDGTLEVWDPHNWQLVVKLYGHGALSLYFSPDGLRLYAHLFEDLRTFSTEMFHPRDDVSAAGQK